MEKLSFFENIYFSCKWIIGLLFFIPSILMFINIKTSNSSFISSHKTKFLQGTILFFLICALSGPLFNPSELSLNRDNHKIFLMLENDWSTQDNWNDAKKKASQIINKAIDFHMPINIASSSPDVEGSFLYATNANPAIAKYWYLPQIKPQKFPDFTKITKNILDSNLSNFDSFWVGHNINYPDKEDALSTLQHYGSVAFIPSKQKSNIFIREASAENDTVSVSLSLAGEKLRSKKNLTLQVLDNKKRPIDIKKATLKSKETNKQINITLPPKLIRQIAFIKIKEANNIGATYKINKNWYKPLILVLGKGMHSSNSGKKSSYKHGGFFISSALEGLADISFDIEDIKNDPASIFIADNVVITPAIENALMLWLEQGGKLIYFAEDKPILNIFKLFDKIDSYKLPQRLEHNNITSNTDGISLYKTIQASDEKTYKDENWQPIISLKNQQPLISEKVIGRGKAVFVHASSAPIGNNIVLNLDFIKIIASLADISLPTQETKNLFNDDLYELQTLKQLPSGIYTDEESKIEAEISISPYFLFLALASCFIEYFLAKKARQPISKLRLIPYSIILIQALRLWGFDFVVKIITMPILLSYIWYRELHKQKQTQPTKE